MTENEQIDAIALKTETDCILSELSGKIEHYFLMEQRAKAKAVEWALARKKFKWLERIIENAAKGDNVSYLESQLGSLETGNYLRDGLKSLWVPHHIVNHAIVLCKQAIANHTFTTAEPEFTVRQSLPTNLGSQQ